MKVSLVIQIDASLLRTVDDRHKSFNDLASQWVADGLREQEALFSMAKKASETCVPDGDAVRVDHQDERGISWSGEFEADGIAVTVLQISGVDSDGIPYTKSWGA